MQLLKIYYAYFSPGNTTEKVVSHIASSFQNYPVESIIKWIEERDKVALCGKKKSFC